VNLRIGRLRTLLVAGAPVEPSRVEHWQGQFAAQDGDALAARWVRADEWLLIRRLPVTAKWSADAADVGRAWTDGLARAIGEALAKGDGNCVRYSSRRAALADLVYRSALGDAERQWAWRRMGFLDRAPVPSDDALRAGVEHLVRAPELIWPVLARLMDGEEAGASLTAALRALPVAAWMQILSACPRTAAYVRAESSAVTARPASESLDDPHATNPARAADPPAFVPGPSASALLRWVARRPHFARRHADVLTVLVAALAGPPEGEATVALRRRVEGSRAALAERWVPAAPAPPSAPSSAPAPEPARAGDRPGEKGAEPAAVRPPDLPDRAHGVPTRFGGALFWLARAGADRVIAAPGVPPAAVRLVLRELARALGVPDDDVAAAAFCGGEVPEDEAPPALVAHAAAAAERWTAWLDDEAPDLAEPRMETVCGRAGHILIEPGWIELVLPLSSADASIRRLGLDLDPGWLPWLGCVVRIRYDDE
jgi:hypothetical protein